MVVVAYEKFLLIREVVTRALTGKILVFWMGGRLWELVVLGSNSTVNILKKWSQGNFI